MAEIAIEVSDVQVLEELETLSKDADGFSSEHQGIDGVQLFTAVMTLGPLVINGIFKIVLAQIAARKHVRVIVDGTEISGVSEKTLMDILNSKVDNQPRK
ncbi:hypothetical protein SMZ27_003223 [Cronobacter sakazakii]|nr:hypothetical protein [Cronobacter sakazakii]ELY4667721.1 hypothetical protein [Cronobacter sakazakii]